MKVSPWTIAVFGILAGTGLLNGIVLYFAIESQSAVMEKEPYERGQAYGEEQAERSVAENNGWRWDLAVSNEPVPKESVLTLTIFGGDGTPLGGAEVTISAKRFDSDQYDRTARLTESNPGMYTATVPLARPARWLFQLTLRRSGQTAILEKTIDLR